MKKLSAIVLLMGWVFSGRTQHPQPSYPSLLWEISGNGLTRPSYLFGSMHVSNKMVFHLSDSFYMAIAACDMVSLEVDPKEWEPDMFRLEQARMTMVNYSTGNNDGYMLDGDFRLKGYETPLAQALREEPYVVNGLLYRTDGFQANFQENTYLDLYIYQTARKLGKMATGVENYLESERISYDATRALLKEKRERKIFPEGENTFTLQNKLQDAYRRGDLDLLDSLNELLSSSKAYTEQFLYRRNDIQAHAIDSIIRRHTLFVAVGAAHLPGARGVIESLRKKGYTLRPVKMTDQDADSREKIDKMRVPVTMRPAITADGFIHCQLPGSWFRRNETQNNEAWQYADMENGSYYMLTRVKTNGAILGDNVGTVRRKLDSLLYDNIPGKILKKDTVTRNGYPGLDIVNKTRTGDLQRYLILLAPSEVLVFKMSGKDDYVSGEEGDQFFRSIRVEEPAGGWISYSPPGAGFKAAFPQIPNLSRERSAYNHPDGLEYDATSPNGDAYLILRRNIVNYHFLEEDTLDLSLMEESLKGSAAVDKEINRKFGKIDGRDYLDMSFSLRNGSVLKGRAIIRGSDYYLLLASVKDSKNAARFFDGFHLTGYQYGASSLYTDTSIHFSVRTSVRPEVEKDLLPLMGGMNPYSIIGDNNTYLSQPRTQFASFSNDSTGESIQVAMTEFPRYFYNKDSSKFWENEMHWGRLKADFILSKKEAFHSGDSLSGYRYTLMDTNTNRKIEGLVEIKGNAVFRVTTLLDRLQEESPFIRDFFASFTPEVPYEHSSLFTAKGELLFKDYHSHDSLTRKRSHEGLNNIVFEASDLPAIQKAISRLKGADKTYIGNKDRLIRSLGRIKDSCCMAPVIAYLHQLYDQAGDTTAFQNTVMLTMARIKQKESYDLLKKWILEKPPVFESTVELRELFRQLGTDSTLVAGLFPDILRLTSIDEYKTPVTDLLIRLSDSNRVRKEAYADHFTNLFYDAQVLLKRLQIGDTRARGQDNSDDRETIAYPIQNLYQDESYSPAYANSDSWTVEPRIVKYARLLIPFYDRPSVPGWFTQLLQTRDTVIKARIAVLMIRNNHPVSDTLLSSIAADDRYRAELYRQLDKIGRMDLFPEKYRNQEAMARSLLMNNRSYDKPVAIEAAGKKWVSIKGEKGNVYFFKYKLKDQDTWLIAYSGLQPEKPGEVCVDRSLVEMTRQKLTSDQPERQQFERRLQQLILSKRKSAARFFRSGNNNQGLFIR